MLILNERFVNSGFMDNRISQLFADQKTTKTGQLMIVIKLIITQFPWSLRKQNSTKNGHSIPNWSCN